IYYNLKIFYYFLFMYLLVKDLIIFFTLPISTSNTEKTKKVLDYFTNIAKEKSLSSLDLLNYKTKKSLEEKEEPSLGISLLLDLSISLIKEEIKGIYFTFLFIFLFYTSFSCWLSASPQLIIM